MFLLVYFFLIYGLKFKFLIHFALTSVDDISIHFHPFAWGCPVFLFNIC